MTEEYFERLRVRVKAWEKKQGRNITLKEFNIITEKMMDEDHPGWLDEEE